MSKKKSTTTVLKSPQRASKRRKFSPKPKNAPFQEETQFLQLNMGRRTPAHDEATINFSINSELLRKFNEEAKASHLETRLSNEQHAINRILNKVPLKTEFEELLKEGNVDFLLPRKYKLLLNKFTALNKALFKAKNMKAEFRDIQYQLQLEGIFISFKDLSQIIYINEEFFTVSEKNQKIFVEINDKNGNNQETEEFLNEKTQSLRDYFIRILKIYHFDFLQSRGEEKDSLLYESQKVWHSEFDIDSMPEIPQKDLSEFYTDGKFLNYRSKSKGKSKSKSKSKSKQKDVLNEKNEEMSNILKNLTFKEKLMESVKEKHEALERNKEKIKRNFKFDVNKMRTIAKMIDEYYKIRNVSSMFVINVIKHLGQSSSFLFLKEKEVQLYIEELTRIYPEWIHYIEHETSPILQIDKSIPLTKIHSHLAAYFS